MRVEVVLAFLPPPPSLSLHTHSRAPPHTRARELCVCFCISTSIDTLSRAAREARPGRAKTGTATEAAAAAATLPHYARHLQERPSAIGLKGLLFLIPAPSSPLFLPFLPLSSLSSLLRGTTTAKGLHTELGNVFGSFVRNVARKLPEAAACRAAAAAGERPRKTTTRMRNS